MRPTVILFDVDGTLVLTGGAGRRALARAFGEVCDRTDALDGVRLGGMTDRLIVRRGLEAIGHPHDPAVVDAVLEAYVGHLPDLVAASKGYRVLPGVRATVDRVLECATAGAHIAVGLGTGNLRRGALIKLSRAGLDALFPFGGFGCDHEDRAELLRAGVRRGAQRLGVVSEACRVVVVGDTPRDVHAAQAIGAECVCVGTGGFTPDALMDSGAQVAFATLADEGAVRAICGTG